MPLLSINPATGEVLRTFPSLSKDELQQRIATASEGLWQHSVTPLEHRVLALRKLSTLILAEAGDLAVTIATETGKPVRHAREEVSQCAELCRYYAEHAVRLFARELLVAKCGQAHVLYKPVGVILAIMPWHSPLWRALHFAIPALMAGNAVLMKHADSVPQCALSTAALILRAGFARGSYTALLMDDSLVETALNDDRVAAVTFTGPAAGGRALAAQAGWLLKRAALHLSGSDAFVVMPSADIEAAVAACVRALALGASAGKRIILHAEIYKAFAGRMLVAVEQLRIGNPLLEATELGPLGTTGALQTMREQVEAAVAAGGRVLSGGSRMIGPGNFFEPTLMSGVSPDSGVVSGALLGPLALLFRAEHVDSAIAMANCTPFTGSAAVWTRNPLEQQRCLNEIKAGFVALNWLPPDDPHPPIGAASSGRNSSATGLEGVVETKTIWIA